MYGIFAYTFANYSVCTCDVPIVIWTDCWYREPELSSGSLTRVARWLLPKHQTLAVPVSVAQNIELLSHALSGITIIFIPKYWTVQLNTGHLATLPVADF